MFIAQIQFNFMLKGPVTYLGNFRVNKIVKGSAREK